MCLTTLVAAESTAQHSLRSFHNAVPRSHARTHTNKPRPPRPEDASAAFIQLTWRMEQRTPATRQAQIPLLIHKHTRTAPNAACAVLHCLHTTHRYFARTHRYCVLVAAPYMLVQHNSCSLPAHVSARAAPAGLGPTHTTHAYTHPHARGKQACTVCSASQTSKWYLRNQATRLYQGHLHTRARKHTRPPAPGPCHSRGMRSQEREPPNNWT